MNILLALSLFGAVASAPDTTVDLREGDRIVLENLSGEIVVETWNRPGMRLVGDAEELEDVTVSRSGSQVRVSPGGRKGKWHDVDMTLRVPPWIELEVSGRSLDIRVAGVQGSVFIRNVEGDIFVRDTGGELGLSTQEGEIEVRGARGPLKARSMGDDVRIFDVVGDVDVESGSGNVILDGVDSRSLQAQTLDGDIMFRGPLLAGGRYGFSVHDGDATLMLPSGTGARMSVSTFDGDFESDFPVTLEGYASGSAFAFTIGSGDAQVDVQVFDGEIRLVEDRAR